MKSASANYSKSVTPCLPAYKNRRTGTSQSLVLARPGIPRSWPTRKVNGDVGRRSRLTVTLRLCKTAVTRSREQAEEDGLFLALRSLHIVRRC